MFIEPQLKHVFPLGMLLCLMWGCDEQKAPSSLAEDSQSLLEDAQIARDATDPPSTVGCTWMRHSAQNVPSQRTVQRGIAFRDIAALICRSVVVAVQRVRWARHVMSMDFVFSPAKILSNVQCAQDHAKGSVRAT